MRLWLPCGAKARSAKALRKCTFPPTGVEVLDLIIADTCVLEVVKGEGPILRERGPGVSIEEILDKTEVDVTVEGDLLEMQI